MRAVSDWALDAQSAGRVSSSRIDADESPNPRTEENPIIDVPAEPHAPEHEWTATPLFGGAHRRPSEAEPTPEERLLWAAEETCSRSPCGRGASRRRAASRRRQHVAEQRAAAASSVRPAAAGGRGASPAIRPSQTDWQPAPAEGQWIPAGTPGSNWSSSAAENGSSGDYVGRRRAARARDVHTTRGVAPSGRHSVPPDATDPGRPSRRRRHPRWQHRRRRLRRPPRQRRRPHHAIAVPKRPRVRTASPPADIPSPSCWPGWRSVPREAAVVAAAKSELVS